MNAIPIGLDVVALSALVVLACRRDGRIEVRAGAGAGVLGLAIAGLVCAGTLGATGAVTGVALVAVVIAFCGFAELMDPLIPGVNRFEIDEQFDMELAQLLAEAGTGTDVGAEPAMALAADEDEPEPEWWPEFEAEFAAYMAGTRKRLRRRGRDLSS